MRDVAPFLVMIAIMLFTVWLIRALLAARRYSRLLKVQTDIQTRLLDKISSSDEVLRYLESGAGRQLLEAPPAERGRPFGRILGSIQAGVILTLAGVGFFAASGQFVDEAEGLRVLGVLGMTVGAGFVISGVIAFFLSRSWGLLDRGGEERDEARSEL